jgi:predicted transcriptional regulator
MLNKIRIHQAKNNELWFNLTDISKQVKIRVSSLAARKTVTAKLFKPNGAQKLYYVNEESFIQIFKKDRKILAELAHYKTTGLLTENSANEYSDLRTVAFIHAQTILKKSGKIKLPFIKEMDLASFNISIEYTPCIRALIQLYAQSVFYETAGGKDSPSCSIQYEIFKTFPVTINLEELYTIYQSSEINPELINTVKTANINKEKLLEFMQQIDSKTLQPQLYGASAGVLAALNSRDPTSLCVVSEVETSSLIRPKALANNWHEYPLTQKFMPKALGEEILWLGE